MSSPEDANYNCRDCESKFGSLKEHDEHMHKIHKLHLSNENNKIVLSADLDIYASKATANEN